MLGIQELKDLASAVAKTAEGVDAILADGTVDVRDLARVPLLLSGLKGFGDVNFAEVIPEATDLDAKESQELAAHFRAVFNLENDSIESVVETGLDIVLAGAQAIQSLRDIWTRVKSIAA